MAWTDLRRSIVVMALMLLVALIVAAFAGSGKNAALVRNSLVAKGMPEEAFRWHPADVPRDFKLEAQDTPSWVIERLAGVAADAQGLAAVEAAIQALHRHTFVGKPIQDELETTWRLIEERGRGYCADYSKVFNAMMLALGLPVREWALGHHDFGSGHTFNEVWLEDQWVFVDAFNGMLIRDRQSGELLSVLQFRQRLEDRDFESLDVIKLTDPDMFFQTREEGLRYYARSTDYFYLIWGNNVFSYDASPWVRAAAKIARPLERAAAIVSGDFPQVRLLETDTNSDAIAHVKLLRRMLYLALIAEVLLGLYLLRLLWRVVRQGRA